jgi:hypothetical protein
MKKLLPKRSLIPFPEEFKSRYDFEFLRMNDVDRQDNIFLIFRQRQQKTETEALRPLVAWWAKQSTDDKEVVP